MGIHKRDFISLFIKEIKVTLGLGHKSSFKGVGVQVISFPAYPNTYIILSPVFYSPQDDHPTLSTGALLASGLFERILEDRHKKLILLSKNGKSMEVPVVEKDLVDYVYLHVHSFGEPYNKFHQPNHFS